MTKSQVINDFLAQRTLAIVGVSRSGKGFGSSAFRELRNKGYKVFPVHPHAETIDGERCYRELAALPEKVGGVLIVVPPAETEHVVREAADSGIERVWMQLGAESDAAVHFCVSHGIETVHGECILMFARPAAFPHRAHHWIRGLLGSLPQ